MGKIGIGEKFFKFATENRDLPSMYARKKFNEKKKISFLYNCSVNFKVVFFDCSVNKIPNYIFKTNYTVFI